MVDNKQEIFEKAMEEASNVLGVDPAYYGEEGKEEVERQLKKMGYSLKDFKKELDTKSEIESDFKLVFLTEDEFKDTLKNNAMAIGRVGKGREFRLGKIHYLKISPDYFNDVRSGLKTFEIRKNDRNFQIGDTLILKEYKHDSFTGKVVRVNVTYITDFAQQANYVVMAIELDD